MRDSSHTGGDAALHRRLRRYGLIGLVVAVVLGVWGEVSRVLARNALAAETARDAVPQVVTISPSRSTVGEELVLPGTVQAFVEAPIYARTSGYLKSWYTDIGAHVVKGQLLAEIETPEVDQQLRQAQADLDTSRANANLSNSTNKRWQALLGTESVSKQDADEKAGDAAAKQAAAASAEANVARLSELKSFKRVIAPFDGVVTARNTDLGALITAGQSSGPELFRVANTDKLRVYVQVPEAYAAATQPGLEAELRFGDQTHKPAAARTVRTSNALDPVSRTLQVELQLDNAAHDVLPGAYAEVHFKLAANAESLRLPANTVLFRAAGLQVATVDHDAHIRLKSIVQGRDFGNTIEVLSGLDAGDVVVVNPSDSVVDGMPVRVAPPAAKDPGKAS